MAEILHKPEFYGSTTVGERGQVVLPVEIRKKFRIQAGDKLLVMGMPGPTGGPVLILVKADVLSGYLDIMDKQVQEFKSKLNETRKKK
jgi:AbrB family looped-hinge helix DNA binding protein